jgi:hypothetical protein
MTEFRKHKSGRQYARIEGSNVWRVLNMIETKDVRWMNSAMMAEEILNTKDIYFPCTEQEFKEAYEEALIRIQNMEIN